MSTGTIKKVAGPLVIAEGMRDANMFDVVRVSSQRLIGEIIEIHGDEASIQVYEETSGLGPGEPVESMGVPMSVELGPGLITSIYDGIQRPLDDIMKISGNNLKRGVEVASLKRDKKWEFVPVAKAGDEVEAGDVLGTVQETIVVQQKIMVPYGVKGTVKEIKGNSFTVAGLKQLSNGDGLVFFNRKGELEGFRVNRVEANRVFPLDMPQLTPKTPLYRNFDQAFDKLLAKPSAERKLSVEIEFLDNPFGFTLCMEDETGARIMLTEPFAKELARREQQDNIRTQLSKLGNTPFEASKVVVGLSENWFVPSSLLADMRRRGVEKLLEARRARYPRETVKRVQPSVSIPFPERQLTYLGNVANGKARSFYQDHGVEQIDPAFELSPRKDVPLMFTKHCLRYSMGWCPTYQKDKSPYKEPYYLLYKDTRLRLQFDCKHCQMLVFES